MKIGSSTVTYHRVALDEDERFDVTTKTRRPITVRVDHIEATNGEDISGGWAITAHGHRVLKSGQLGKREKLDPWTYANTFQAEAYEELFETFSPEVAAAFTKLGVSF